jgi:hypothetical protein
LAAYSGSQPVLTGAKMSYDTSTILLSSIVVVVAGILTFVNVLSGEAFTALAGTVLGYVFRRSRDDYAIYHSDAIAVRNNSHRSGDN